MKDDENTLARHRHDDAICRPVQQYHYQHQPQQQQQQQYQDYQRSDDGEEATAACNSRPRRGRRHEKLHYNGVCGYYICYSIFVSVVGLALIVVLLALHLARCVVGSSDHYPHEAVYDCFVSLRLGHAQRRAASTAH